MTILTRMLVICTILAASPSIAGNQVLILKGSTGLFKYDATSGDYLGKIQCYVDMATAAGPPGVFYTGGANSHHIYGISLSTGNYIGTYPSPSTYLTGCMGLAFGPDGYLYASDTYADRILRINISTGESQLVALSTAIRGPSGIAFGPDGDLYVCAAVGSDRQVQRYNLSTGSLVETYVGTKDLTAPQQIGFSASGDLYALNQCSFGLYRLDRSSGQFNEVLMPTANSGFSRMAFVADGTIYLTYYEYEYPFGHQKVMRYNPQTGDLSYFMDGDVITVVTVPEHGTLASILGMLSGFSCMLLVRGSSSWRSRKPVSKASQS